MITKEQLNELDHVNFETECITKAMLDKYRVVLLMGHTQLVGEVAPIREYEQDWIGVRRHNAESWELYSYHAVYGIVKATKRQIAIAIGWLERLVYIVKHDGQLVRSGYVLLCELDEKMSGEFGDTWSDHYWVLNTLPSWVVVPKQPERSEYDPFNED